MRSYPRFKRYADNWVWSNATRSRTGRPVRSEFRPFKPIRAQSLSVDGFVAWRGRSGRGYVFSVHPIGPLTFDQAVVVAVRRCRYMRDAYVLDVRCVHRRRPDCDARLATWAAALGAEELHLHRLAQTDAERRAVAEDLRPRAGEYFFRDTEETLARLKRPVGRAPAEDLDAPEADDGAGEPVRPVRRLPADARGAGGDCLAGAVRGGRRRGSARQDGRKRVD